MTGYQYYIILMVRLYRPKEAKELAALLIVQGILKNG